LIAVITIYYCFLVFSTSRQLYEDWLLYIF
jgi:hypothetical protein